MIRHLSDEQILALGGRKEEATVSPALAAHAADCPVCRRRREELRSLAEALRAPALALAPETWVRAAREWIQEQEATARKMARPGLAASVRRGLQTARGQADRIVHEVQAILALDSFAGTALQGIRGSATLQPRQLLYESSLGNLHLQIDSEGTRTFSLLGQLIPSDGVVHPSEARVVLEQNQEETTRRMQASGEFRFRGIGPGRFRLRLEWSGHRLIIDWLELPAGDDA